MNIRFDSIFEKYIFLAIFIVFFSSLINAQVNDSTSSISRTNHTNSNDTIFNGSINYNLPLGFLDLVESYKKANYASPGIDGFRVQILSDAGNNAKERAQSSLVDFEQKFPGIPVYLTYQQPNFKVRCGNFRTKAEARRMLNEVSSQFPGSYVVRDYIKPPKD
jgi:hypothetical protein